jgi:HK97 family phage prohead protease
MTTTDAPREDLIRMTTTLRHEEAGNLLIGYAAVFNDPTEIDSWEGRFTERIARGAFKKTLSERGDRVKVLFNHGMDPSIGDKPLGKPSVMKEDERGLYVEVPLDDTSYNADIKALLRSGALDGMSFRMTVLAEDWTYPKEGSNDLPARVIKEVRLHEFGPVTFPAYAASVAGVRAHAPIAFEAWRSATGTPKTTDSTTESEQDPPAGDDATGDPSEPDQTTRSDDAPEGAVTPYQPVRPVPVARDRRSAEREDVRAMVARLTRSA